MTFTRDGGVVPSHIRAYRPDPEEHGKAHGLCRGYVQKAVYQDDEGNKTGQLEYIVTINGQDYSGVLDLTGPGGIFQNQRRIRQGADFSIEGPVLDSTYEEHKNGELVFCLMMDGDGDVPVIIAGGEHPLINQMNDDWTPPSASDGMVDRFEWNGLEFKTDDDGTYTITILGKKDILPGVPVPVVVNKDAVGSVFSITKDGDFSYVGAQGTTIAVTNMEDKIALTAAFGDTVTVSAADGIQATTPAAGGTALSMKDGKVDLSAALGITVTSSTGDVTVAAAGSAKAKFSAGQIGFSGVGGVELLDLFDQTLAQVSTMAEKAASMATDDAAHIHGTGVGPSSPPTTASAYVQLAVDFTAAKTAITLIKTQLGTIKGGT